MIFYAKLKKAKKRAVVARDNTEARDTSSSRLGRMPHPKTIKVCKCQ